MKTSRLVAPVSGRYCDACCHFIFYFYSLGASNDFPKDFFFKSTFYNAELTTAAVVRRPKLTPLAANDYSRLKIIELR